MENLPPSSFNKCLIDFLCYQNNLYIFCPFPAMINQSFLFALVPFSWRNWIPTKYNQKEASLSVSLQNIFLDLFFPLPWTKYWTSST